MGSRDPFAALHALSSHLVPTYEAGGTSGRGGGTWGLKGPDLRSGGAWYIRRPKAQEEPCGPGLRTC